MSNVSSFRYDLAAYAVLCSVIREQLLPLVGSGTKVGGGVLG